MDNPTLIRCYHPHINISDLGGYIYVPSDGVFGYTKKLYETGLGHRATPPQRGHEIQEFFLWRSKYMATNRLCRWLIDLLMS